MPLNTLRGVALLILAILWGPTSARAQNVVPGEPGYRTRTFLWENDNPPFDRADKHYTNGLRYADAMTASPRWVHRMRREALWKTLVFGANPCGAGATSECYHVRTGFVVGQNLYTPTDITRRDPQPDDRPYAGILYLGRTFELVRGRWQHEMEYDFGVVGPLALGESVQVGWHEVTDSWTPEGWHNQLGTGLLAHAILRTHYQVVEVPLPLRSSIELLPRVQVVAGTPFTNGRAGAILRLGRNIPAAVESYIPAAAPPLSATLERSDSAAAVPGDPLPTDRATRAAILEQWELQAVRERRHARRPRHRPAPLYFFLAADVTGVAHNALIEGIPLRSDNPAAPALERVFTEVQAGVVFRVLGTDITLRRLWRSGEFQGDDPHFTWTLGITR